APACAVWPRASRTAAAAAFAISRASLRIVQSWYPSPKRRMALGSIGMHARDLAALAGSRADGLDRRQHFRVLRIEGRRLPHAEREVRGSDIDTVKTLDRDDLVEVLHGLARLDHGEDENFVIRGRPIVAAAIEKRAVGAEAARAARRIAAGTDQRLRFRLRVDRRANDAVSARVPA